MKKLIFLFILFTTFASSEVVKNIEISGNKRITSETIILFGSIDIDVDYNDQKINNVLKNLYKTDIGIKIYKAEEIVHLNRELVINYDEDCSESTPVPMSFSDLGIRNDYSVSDWIVGNIATALLEE